MDAKTLARCLATQPTLAGLVEALVSEATDMPGIETLPALAAALLDPACAMPVLPDLPPYEAQYAANIETLRQGVDWGTLRVRPEHARPTLASPATHDVLVSAEPVIGWGPITLLTHAALSLIKPRKQSAVVVTMRDDGISILEWVAHYRAVGFDAIFIYSNDNEDGSDTLLRTLAGHKIVTFIENETTRSVSPQRKAFAHSLHFLPELRDYEWVFYADSDEFLVLGPEYDFMIKGVLKRLTEDYASQIPFAICYHWKWFVSDYAKDRTAGLLLDRFQYTKESPLLIKSIVRLADTVSMRILHFPETLSGGVFVDSALSVIDASRSNDRSGVWRHSDNRYVGGQVNHYWCKSFAEFLVKKRRGDSLLLSEENNDYKRDISLFFQWNGSSMGLAPDGPSPVLLDRVVYELAKLRRLEDLDAISVSLEIAFEALVDKSLAGRDLASVYSEVATYCGLPHLAST